MTEQPLDGMRDRMVRALYGELPDDERRELDEAMASDEALRQDWQELQEARAMLAVLRDDEARSRRAVSPAGDLPFRLPAERVPRSPGRWVLAAAAGFLLAVLLGGGLLASGLRVDRTPGGFVVRFGAETGPDPTLQAASAKLVAPDGQEYLTRAEFVAITQALAGVTAARFDDLERRQTETQTETAKLLFRALSTRQERQYNDLRTRLDLAAVRQARTNQTTPARLEVPVAGGEGRER